MYVCICMYVHVGTYVCMYTPTWDRCYDFLNIFAEKLSEKIGIFDS
jgi:hypothetical protein